MTKFVTDHKLALDVHAARWIKRSDVKSYLKEGGTEYRIEYSYRGVSPSWTSYANALDRDAMWEKICQALAPRQKEA
jgi:hypothetical protein